MTEYEIPPKLLKEVINPWLLGADPEFAVLTPPDILVPNSGENAVSVSNTSGAIGSDHQGRVWELRPAPSPSAYAVTLNLWKLLQQQELDKLEKFKWKSGALGGKRPRPPIPTLNGLRQPFLNLGYSTAQATQMAQAQLDMHVAAQQLSPPLEDTLGGHIHYGITALNADQRAALKAVTVGLLDLDILPHKENTRRLQLSAQSGYYYGHLNQSDAIRSCNGHVEYRCAPSWLDKPLQAWAVLTTYKLAAARPSSVNWPSRQDLKQGFLEWLDALAGVDIDAHGVMHFINLRGFEAIQADPSSDFKPRWRRERGILQL